METRKVLRRASCARSVDAQLYQSARTNVEISFHQGHPLSEEQNRTCSPSFQRKIPRVGCALWTPTRLAKNSLSAFYEKSASMEVPAWCSAVSHDRPCFH